jgi:hypothetical protein
LFLREVTRDSASAAGNSTALGNVLFECGVGELVGRSESAESIRCSIEDMLAASVKAFTAVLFAS